MYYCMLYWMFYGMLYEILYYCNKLGCYIIVLLYQARMISCVYVSVFVQVL